MIKSHGWWFPEGETHFPKMLDKSVRKGAPAEYQQTCRHESLSLCSRRGLALDIGANVGLWTRELCENFDQVIAVEPVADFRACLELNVTATNLKISPVAVGAESTKINMIITADNSGHSHVDTASMGSGFIQMLTLDMLMNTIGNPVVDYIKIDCEGYENNIVLGGKQTITTGRPIMVVEDKKHKDVGHNNYDQAIGTLLSWGAVEIGRVRDDVILGWRD